MSDARTITITLPELAFQQVGWSHSIWVRCPFKQVSGTKARVTVGRRNAQELLGCLLRVPRTLGTDADHKMIAEARNGIREFMRKVPLRAEDDDYQEILLTQSLLDRLPTNSLKLRMELCPRELLNSGLTSIRIPSRLWSPWIAALEGMVMADAKEDQRRNTQVSILKQRIRGEGSSKEKQKSTSVEGRKPERHADGSVTLLIPYPAWEHLVDTDVRLTYETTTEPAASGAVWATISPSQAEKWRGALKKYPGRHTNPSIAFVLGALLAMGDAPKTVEERIVFKPRPDGNLNWWVSADWGSEVSNSAETEEKAEADYETTTLRFFPEGADKTMDAMEVWEDPEWMPDIGDIVRLGGELNPVQIRSRTFMSQTTVVLEYGHLSS